MKPRYVEVRGGESRILWDRFLTFALVVIGLGLAIGELIAYLAMHRFGTAAPVAGAVVGVLLVVRKFLEVRAYQPSDDDEALAA